MDSENQYLQYQSDCSYSDTDYNPEKVIDNKRCTNSGFNYGISSRLQYDPCYIRDDITQSTAPLQSVIDPNRVKSCQNCVSLFGPRASHNGTEDSIPISEPGLTPAQSLVDIDSVMSNRNVKASRCKRDFVNPVDVFKYQTYDNKFCNRFLDPMATIESFPKQLYREMSINRFYDTINNPQVNIYYDWAVNTQLEAKDNYDNPYPFSIAGNDVLPNPIPGTSQTGNIEFDKTTGVNVYDRNDNTILTGPDGQSIPADPTMNSTIQMQQHMQQQIQKQMQQQMQQMRPQMPEQQVQQIQQMRQQMPEQVQHQMRQQMPEQMQQLQQLQQQLQQQMRQ